MIDAIEDVERRLEKPVVNSNQAVLWAALRRLEITEPSRAWGAFPTRSAQRRGAWPPPKASARPRRAGRRGDHVVAAVAAELTLGAQGVEGQTTPRPSSLPSDSTISA
jgi:hypothetical protein